MKKTALSAALLFSTLALSACGSTSLFGSSSETLACTPIEVPGLSRTLVAFKDTGRDLTDVLLEAEILSYQASCSYENDRSVVVTDLILTFRAAKGPASTTDQEELRYYVAVARKGAEGAEPEVLTREEFSTTLTFTGNRRRVGLVEELTPRIPLQEGEDGSDYRIYVGLLLTPEQFSYNEENL